MLILATKFFYTFNVTRHPVKWCRIFCHIVCILLKCTLWCKITVRKPQKKIQILLKVHCFGKLIYKNYEKGVKVIQSIWNERSSYDFTKFQHMYSKLSSVYWTVHISTHIFIQLFFYTFFFNKFHIYKSFKTHVKWIE